MACHVGMKVLRIQFPDSQPSLLQSTHTFATSQRNNLENNLWHEAVLAVGGGGGVGLSTDDNVNRLRGTVLVSNRCQK